MKYLLYSLTLIFSSLLSAQTVLISPTVKNGGFEDAVNTSWVLANGTQANKWQISTNALTGFSGSKSAYISASASAPYAHAYNVLPSSATFIYQDVVFPAGENIINLSFKVNVQGENTGSPWDFLRVFVVDQSVPITPGLVLDPAAQTVNWTYSMLGNSWTTQNVFISSAQAGNATANSPKRLVFQWKNDGGGGVQPPAAIDDVTLVTSSCPTSTALPATNITLNSGQANWTALAGATSYQLEYRPAGTSSWMSIPVGNSTSYVLTSLSANTYYEYRVMPIGGSCSFFSNIITFKTGYCDVGSSSQLSWLRTFVSSGALSNISYNNTALSSSPTGYKDESANHAVNHYAGSSFNLQMSAGASPPGWAIWIDWNNNFLFEPSEKVYDSNSYLTNATGQISIPATTANGQYRMRVVLDTNSASPNNACGNISAGEIVDFSLNVVSAPTCFPPTNLAVSNVTPNSAQLTFTAPSQGAAISYDYYISTNNTAPIGTTIPTGSSASPSIDLTQLQAATHYFVWVRSVCSGNDKSIWTSPLSFTTSCGVFALPYSQNFENVTSSGFPVCTSAENAGNGNIWIVNVPNTNGFSSKALTYFYDTASPGNTWFYTPAIALEAGKQYAISYKYGNDGDPSLPEKLKVAYGTSPNPGAMVNLIKDYPNVVTNGPATDKIIFSPAASGNYYFGFNAYSLADMNVLMVDDILIELNGVVWDGSQWSNITGPTSATNAYIEGHYNGGSITSADLSISTGINFTMNGELNAANIQNQGTMVLAQDGTMLYSGAFTNIGAGNFEVQKNVTPAAINQYSFWSSPVASVSMFEIFNNGTPQFVTDYATATNTWSALPYPATSASGKGYSIKTPAGATIAAFFGTPNNGNIVTTISAPNAAPADNYVLLGNPYPSLLSLSALTSANSSTLYGSYWLWDKAAESYGTYNSASSTYVPAPGSSVLLTDGKIHPAQGFLAEAVSGSTSVAFNNTMRSTGSTGYLNKSAASSGQGKFWLKLNASATQFSTMAITYGYGDDGRESTDSKSLSSTPNELLSILSGEKLIIQGKGAFNDQDAIALAVKLAADAQYTIVLSQTEGIFANGQEVILHDKLMNIYHNLSKGIYTFQGTAGEHEERFTILYRKAVQLTAVTEVSIAKNGEVFTVTSPEAIRMVEVYDTAGRLVKKVQGGGTTVDVSISARGAYVVNIVTVKETVSKKVVK